MKLYRSSENKIYKIILLIVFFGPIQNGFSQATKNKDMLYFDSDWQPTTRKKHKFYRPLPLKTIGNLSLIQDYYKNGTMQMQGYAYTDSLDVHVGDWYWYDQNGFDTKNTQYSNTTNNPLVYYHNNGVVWKTINYKNGIKDGSIKLFNDKGKVIHLDDISYLGKIKSSKSGRGLLKFYKKKEANKYLKVSYEFLHDKTIPKQSFRIIEKSNDNYTYKEIKRHSGNIIKVSKIKTQSVESLLKMVANKEWCTYTKSRNYSGEIINNKRVFKQFNSELFIDLNFKFTYGCFFKNIDDEDNYIKKWRLKGSEFYTITILILNKNKPILILTQGDNIKYYIIPTNNNGLLENFIKKNTIAQTSSPLSDSIFKEIMLHRNSDTNNFYSIRSKKGKKYLTNLFNEIVIDKGYDVIQRNKEFIIGRNGEGIDIYNFKLEKLPIRNIRRAYYDSENLQILVGNRVKYIDVAGKETSRRIIRRYSPHCLYELQELKTNFEVIKSNKKEPVNAIKITELDGFSGITHIKTLRLKNLTAECDVKFLNKTTTDGYDEDSRLIEGYVDRTHLLVVHKDDKAGLYAYNDDDVEFDWGLEELQKDEMVDLNAGQYGSTQAEELLPIQYDDIELRAPLIIVKKGEKYGIYPLKNGLNYKSLGKVEGNFIEYETNKGEKGWIDINTHKEYPNEK